MRFAVSLLFVSLLAGQPGPAPAVAPTAPTTVSSTVPALPQNYLAAVVECACSSSGVPSINGGGFYGYLVNKTAGIYFHAGYNITFQRNTQSKFPPVLATAVSAAGFDWFMRRVGPIYLFSEAASGIATTGSSTGANYQLGGFGYVRLSKSVGLTGGAWWSKSTVADPLNKTGTIIAFGPIYSWN